jgi:methyl-accepting chemotaxis protein
MTSPADQQTEALFEREQTLLQAAHHRYAIRTRYAFVALGYAIALADGAWDVTPASATLFATIPTGMLFANAVNDVLYRFGRFASWQFWLMIVLDATSVCAAASLVGGMAYLAIPFLIVATGTHALGLPRAAGVQLALSAVLYPAARIASFLSIGTTVPWGVVILEWLVLVVFGWLAARGPITYTRRVRTARRALAGLEQGDFTVRLPARARDDVGFLAISFNSTAEAVGKMVRDIQEQAAALTRLAGDVAASARRTAEIAERIVATTRAGSEEAQQQATLVEQGRQDVEGIAAQNAGARADALASADDAERLAGQAGAQSERASRAGALLVELGEDFTRTGDAIERLDQAREQVRDFIHVIQQIASQSRLLSLNAAIEASRAGEQGKGFAVVAEEIGKLASQSAQSAREVSQAVAAVEEAVSEVRARVHAGTRKVASVGSVSDGARAALDTMVEGVRRLSSFFSAMAPRIDAQGETLNAHRAAIGRIVDLSHAALDKAHANVDAATTQRQAMEELARASSRLAETAGAMDALARRFRVE